MLSDLALKKLKPQNSRYKATDRDGMYASVSTTGAISFRYDYRINGRRETVTFGQYGPDGISLALAREKLIDAKNAIAQGQSPAQLKKRKKRRVVDLKRFEECAENWFSETEMADSTRAMRRGTYNRDIYPALKGRLLTEINAADLRALCVFADDLERLVVGGRGWRLDPDPGRLSLDRIIRLVRLFRVTGATISRYRLN